MTWAGDAPPVAGPARTGARPGSGSGGARPVPDPVADPHVVPAGWHEPLVPVEPLPAVAGPWPELPGRWSREGGAGEADPSSRLGGPPWTDALLRLDDEQREV